MGSLTISGLDEQLVASLREQALRHGRSVEEEARAILRGAVAGSDASRPEESVADTFRRIRAEYGPIPIEPPPREKWREPPDFSE